jgi:hypothetical protein
MTRTLDTSAGGRARPAGRGLLRGPVRPVRVEVIDVLAEDQPQMPLTGDQHLVQALPSRAGNTALSDSVRPRRPNGSPDEPHADGGEHCVERCGELGVPVPVG